MKTTIRSFLAGLALLFLAACASSDVSSAPPLSGHYVMLMNKMPGTKMVCDAAPGSPFVTDASVNIEIPSFNGAYKALVVKVYDSQGELKGSKTLYVSQTGKVGTERPAPAGLSESWQSSSYGIWDCK